MTAALWLGLIALLTAWTEVRAEVPGPEAGRPRLLVFGSQGCAPCKRLAPLLEELRREFADRAAVVYRDVWREGGGQADVDAYALRALPTLLFFDGQGVLRHRLEGFTGEEDLRSLLKDVSPDRP